MRQRCKKIIYYGLWLLKYSVLTIFFMIISIPLRFNKKYKNLWVISERPDEARDNGYWLYKWILDNKPDENIRYVLSRKSKDYEKMPRKDLIIEPGSPKHYIYYILSSYSVSTHMHGACPGKSFCIPFLPFMRKKKTIFLQHGIAKDVLPLRGGMDAIVSSSRREQALLGRANPRYIGKIFITGLCRYDTLEDTSRKSAEKVILVMPTFRRWLRDIGRLKNADDVFRKAEYFHTWNEFLNDEKLAKVLAANHMKLIFCPHKEMQKFLHDFHTKDPRIEISKPGEYDIQELLKKSSVLVTDYSSIFFDFVYMKKPVLFYQFDQADFFSKHYKSSGEKYPLGDIFAEKDALIAELIKTIEGGCKIKKKYLADSDSFFNFRDRENCERNYNMIRNLK